MGADIVQVCWVWVVQHEQLEDVLWCVGKLWVAHLCSWAQRGHSSVSSTQVSTAFAFSSCSNTAAHVQPAKPAGSALAFRVAFSISANIPVSAASSRKKMHKRISWTSRRIDLHWENSRREACPELLDPFSSSVCAQRPLRYREIRWL